MREKPEKYELVSWEDEIPDGKIENGPNHQPAHYNHGIQRDTRGYKGHSFWPPKPIINQPGCQSQPHQPLRKIQVMAFMVTHWTVITLSFHPFSNHFAPWNPSCATKRRLEVLLNPATKKKWNTTILGQQNSDGPNTKPGFLTRVFKIYLNIRGEWLIIVQQIPTVSHLLSTVNRTIPKFPIDLSFISHI